MNWGGKKQTNNTFNCFHFTATSRIICTFWKFNFKQIHISLHTVIRLQARLLSAICCCSCVTLHNAGLSRLFAAPWANHVRLCETGDENNSCLPLRKPSLSSAKRVR